MNFVVMRPADTQEEGGSGREGHSRAARRPEPQYFRRRSTYMKVKLNINQHKPTLRLPLNKTALIHTDLGSCHLLAAGMGTSFYTTKHNVGRSISQTLHVSVYTV